MNRMIALIIAVSLDCPKYLPAPTWKQFWCIQIYISAYYFRRYLRIFENIIILNFLFFMSLQYLIIRNFFKNLFYSCHLTSLFLNSWHILQIFPHVNIHYIMFYLLWSTFSTKMIYIRCKTKDGVQVIRSFNSQFNSFIYQLSVIRKLVN